MTNAVLSKIMKDKGVSKETVKIFNKKYDAEEVCKIVESAESPGKAFEKLKEMYPEIDIEEAVRQTEQFQKQFEAAAKNGENEKPIQLSQDKAEMVMGSSWWEGNWKKVVKAVCIGLLIGASGARCGKISDGGFENPPGAVTGAVVFQVIMTELGA